MIKLGWAVCPYATAALNGSTQKMLLQRNVADTGRLIPGTPGFRLLIK
jgi:hypothetical protein